MTEFNRAMPNTAAPYWAPSQGERRDAKSTPASADNAAGPFVPPALRRRPPIARTETKIGVFLTNTPATVVVDGTPVSHNNVVSSPTPRDLPWIDTFLDTSAAAAANRDGTPNAAPLRDAVEQVSEQIAPTADANNLHESVEAHVEPAAQSQASTEDAWPLEEAGQEVTELANELNESAIDASAGGVSESPTAAAPAAPLPMWNDEEWMDIMPMSPPVGAQETAQPERPWADMARDAAARRGEIESAAAALEGLAQRVRSGDLPLPGYQPALGDAAALAAALAALLGVRR